MTGIGNSYVTLAVFRCSSCNLSLRCFATDSTSSDMSASPALATPPPAESTGQDGTDQVFVDGLIYPPPEVKGASIDSQLGELARVYVARDPRFYEAGSLPSRLLVLVDKTAAYIANQPNPTALEAKIRAREGKTAKLGFLLPEDPYHAYYRHRLTLVQKGEATPGTPQAADAAPAQKEEPDDGRPKGPEPAPYDFLVEVPKINAVDL
jgi:hypothetical protein